MIKYNITGAALAFCAGALIAWLSYLASRYVLQKRPSRYPAVQAVKQPLQIVFLVLLFAFGDKTPWDRAWLLAGGCLGLTLPMFWFTYRLVKLNDSMHRKEEPADG